MVLSSYIGHGEWMDGHEPCRFGCVRKVDELPCRGSWVFCKCLSCFIHFLSKQRAKRGTQLAVGKPCREKKITSLLSDAHDANASHSGIKHSPWHANYSKIKTISASLPTEDRYITNSDILGMHLTIIINKYHCSICCHD